jgi:hypothetical protein
MTITQFNKHFLLLTIYSMSHPKYHIALYLRHILKVGTSCQIKLFKICNFHLQLHGNYHHIVTWTMYTSGLLKLSFTTIWHSTFIGSSLATMVFFSNYKFYCGKIISVTDHGSCDQIFKMQNFRDYNILHYLLSTTFWSIWIHIMK